MNTPRTDKFYEEVWRFTNETDAVDALISMRDLCREFERENAALRADKERLDYMEQNVDFVSWRFYGKPQLWDLRAAVDSKMKEAQP